MLKIDQREYSPTVIDQIVFAGGSCESATKASRALKLARLEISGTEVLRITQQIGDELLQQREHDADWQRRRERKSANEQPVEIACVEVAGGRMRTRAAGHGRGVHQQAWKETKVAALWKMTGPAFDHDPHFAPPRCVLDPQHVPKMVREIKTQRCETHERDEITEKTGPKSPAAVPHAESLPTRGHEREWPPQRIFRTCVATLKDVYGFGPLVAAEAQRRGFYDAARQVFLGDGDHKNGIVHKLHFPDFVAITDFVHPVTSLYDAAGAVTSSWAAHWEQYTS